MSKPYKVVISLTDLEASPELQEGLTCEVSAEGLVTKSQVPFSEAIFFEISDQTKSINVSFLKEGEEVAKGELFVPADLYKHAEIETTETLKTSTSHNGKSEKELSAKFSLTFINSEEIKTKKVPASPATAPQVSPTKKFASSGISHLRRSTDRSPVISSRIDTGRSKSPRGPSKEKLRASELNGFLNGVVDKHLQEANALVGRDRTETSECVYLNKFSHVAASQLVNSSVLSPSKRADGTPREDTSLDQTHSPEKLKEKFRASMGSKSSRLAGPDMASILMETESRRYVNEYKNQLEYLRNVVYMLDLKLQGLDGCQREVGSLRAEADHSNQSREELRKTLLETTKDLKDESEKFGKLVVDMEAQNKDILRDLKVANNKVDDLQTKLHAQEVRNAQLEADNAEMRIKLKASEAYKSQLHRLTNEYANAEKRHADSSTQLGSRVEELDHALAKAAHEKVQLREENNRLMLTNSELKVQLAQEKGNNNTLKDEMESLNVQVRLTNVSIDILKGIQEQRDQVHAEVTKLKQSNENLIAQIENMEREVVSKTKEGLLSDISNRDELLRHQRKVVEVESQLKETKAAFAKTRKDNSELRNHILTLEQLLCVKEDVYAQLESSQLRLEARQNDCDQMRSLQEANTKVVEDLNDKIIELEKLTIYLKNALSDKDDVT